LYRSLVCLDRRPSKPRIMSISDADKFCHFNKIDATTLLSRSLNYCKTANTRPTDQAAASVPRGIKPVVNDVTKQDQVNDGCYTAMRLPIVVTDSLRIRRERTFPTSDVLPPVSDTANFLPGARRRRIISCYTHKMAIVS